MNTRSHLFFGVVLVLLVFGIVWGIFHIKPYADTKHLVRAEASRVLHLDLSDYADKDDRQTINRLIPTKYDSWGNPINYHVEITPNVVTVIVTSAGPDGMIGSSDDITGIATDYNKSRIIGQWFGKKAKQVGTGVIEGLKEKTIFDKAYEKQQPEKAKEVNGRFDKIKNRLFGE